MSARAYIEPGKIPPAVKELLEALTPEVVKAHDLVIVTGRSRRRPC